MCWELRSFNKMEQGGVNRSVEEKYLIEQVRLRCTRFLPLSHGVGQVIYESCAFYGERES